MLWDEHIESLMISFAPFDPAFEDLLDDPGFREVVGRAGEMTLDVEHLGGRVHRIEGAGSNLVASVGDDGVLLVDTGYGPALPALRSALASLGDARADVLVLTHIHEDHLGASPELGGEAMVLAHPATAGAMDEPFTFMEGVVLPPKPPEARPDRTVTDTTFAFNGEEVRILSVAAHTEGDLAVHFSGSKVLHLADAYLAGNPMMFPGTDDPDAFLHRLESFLRELPADTRVVGGHDDPALPAHVLAQIAETRGCMALVREAVAEGADLDGTVARAEGRFPAPWVRFFYRVFTADEGGS